MASKAFEVLPFIFLLLIVLSAIRYAKRDISTDKKSSSFEFINHLKDCRKGNNRKGIHQLKTYLQRFGYLEYLNETHANNDDFNDALESAIKTYQQNYDIKPTGLLDATTIQKMTMPRCGVPDIINGTNYMQPRKKKQDLSSSVIHIVSHYSFFSGNPRWPLSQTHLTYRFLWNVFPAAKAPLASAFQRWASATQFTFSEAQNKENAHIVVGFYKGNHGDGAPFDGPGGVISHAFAPTDGRLHFDADELWSNGAFPHEYDLVSAAMHEIGHVLGLGHSQVKEAIMYPVVPIGMTKLDLHPDDILGIQALYHVRRSSRCYMP